MGNIGRAQLRLDVLPAPELAVAADGELVEWWPTAPAGRLAAPADTARPPAPDPAER